MRVILNIHFRDVRKARVISLPDKTESNLREVLETGVLDNGTRLSDIVLTENMISEKYSLYVNGTRMPDYPDFNLKIRDNVQIHLEEKHN